MQGQQDSYTGICRYDIQRNLIYKDMKVENNKVVALSYELHVEGNLADQAGEDKPLEYIHGTGMLLPRFEEEVNGKEVGESFEFVLTPEEGYGVHNADYMIELPMESFAIDGQVRTDLLQEGRIIPMLNQNGEVIQGKVAQIKENSVLMDFNHPMAGKTLHFTGKVVSVREATEDELQNGLQHKCHCGKKDGEECGCKDGECGDKGCCGGGCN